MNWMLKPTLMILVGFALILAACAAPTAEPTTVPTLAPTQKPTDVPTLAPTDTAIPATDTAVPVTDTPTATASVSFANDIMPILHGDAANSLFAQQLLNGKMPKKGPKLIPAQIQLIIDWVNAGALNN